MVNNSIPVIDLFTGIGGFHVAGNRNGHFHTVASSEIDPFNVKHIEQNLNLNNGGDIHAFAISEAEHPYKTVIEQEDSVPCEQHGYSSICMEDFYEGVLEWPRLGTGGFPCQNISSANTQCIEGINGAQSGLVWEQLRILSDLDLDYMIFENAERFTSKGLNSVLMHLDSLGYCAQWSVISATAFGYPHYRHRTYLVAYKPDTPIAKLTYSIFDAVRAQATPAQWKFPIADSTDQNQLLELAVAEEPRSIKLRTKRINGLGNAIIPDIAEAIFNVISDSEGLSKIINKKMASRKLPNSLNISSQGWIEELQGDLFGPSLEPVNKMPSEGKMVKGTIYYTEQRCHILNPTKQAYSNLFSTLIRKDGNNNFSSNSRMNRPGKLGGLIGDLQRLGASSGGLHPNFAELFMGYEKDFTKL